jgi:isoleucyl-tRNA synthetase
LTTLSKALAPFIPFLTEQMYQNLVRQVDASAPESVHFCDYPDGDGAQIDAKLSSDMAAVLEVIRLGRSARTEAGIKVRQPLQGIKVYTREPAFLEAVLTLQDQLLDELNIKSVSPLTDLGDVVSYEIRPNLSLLGPKYGKRLDAIRQALQAASALEIAEQVKAGQTVALALADGSTVSIEPAEILVDLKKTPGYAAAQGPNSTVVLDTVLTPELVAEGLVRDFIRGAQDARKDAGLRIEDRISLTYDAPDGIGDALLSGSDLIKTETLATSLTSGPVANGSYSTQVKVGDAMVKIGLAKV